MSNVLIFCGEDQQIVRRFLAICVFLALLAPANVGGQAVIHVVIEEADVTTLGSWPLNRKWHAAALNNLVSSGAQRIFMDIAFPQADVAHPESDDYFFSILETNPHIFLLTSPENIEGEMVLLLGNRELPASRFFAPFSQTFSVDRNHIKLQPFATKSLLHNMLSESMPRYSALIDFPASVPPAHYSFQQVLANAVDCKAKDVVISIDVPGVTSYIVKSDAEHPFTTTELQLHALREIKNGKYYSVWSNWYFGSLMLLVLLPLIFLPPRIGKMPAGIISICAALIIFALFGIQRIYVANIWYLIFLVPLAAMMYQYVSQRTDSSDSNRTAQPKLSSVEPESTKLSGEINQLRYKLKFYEHLESQDESAPVTSLHETHGILCDPKSPLLPILEKATKIAATTIPVMILGESGVGKEKVAQFIHNSSARSQKPFIAVNCAALNENLIESELFGHEAGAFTGASKRKIGRFEMADGGTLFLDEIGETSLSTQVKLLRVLQEGVFERVGGTEEIHISVRIITATHRSLKSSIEMGVFRSDLFFRLNGFPLTVPPLRERKMDIEYLFRKALLESNPELKISQPIINWLVIQHWPGNVRELLSAIQRAAINADLSSRNFLLPKDFELQEPVMLAPDAGELLSERILECLQKHKFKHRCISATAAELSIHRVTVTEYFRGWIIRLLLKNKLDLQAVQAELRGGTEVKDMTQFRLRVEKYSRSILDKIKEGLAAQETEKEIQSRRFKNIPGEFEAELLALIVEIKGIG